MRMEHDTSKTFREIHGTAEMFESTLHGLKSFTVDRNEQNIAGHPLRLLCPFAPHPSISDSSMHLRLTSLAEHTTAANYVTVSYTWAQPAGLASKANLRMPDYLIHAEGEDPRPPRCPPLVLHRALCFASMKLERPLLWIDQECIAQDDPSDVERHLQIMHTIYESSCFTAAILTQLIDSNDLLRGSKPLTDLETSLYRFLSPIGEYDCREECRLLLEHLIRDPWFTRTWIFQERSCASACIYLVPIKAGLTGLAPINYNASRDILIPAARLSKMRMLFKEFENADFISLEDDILCIIDLIAIFFDTSRATYLPTHSSSRPSVVKILSHMEKCHNAIVSDRLAIFANILGQPWALKSRELMSLTTSFSTCILALVLINGQPLQPHSKEDVHAVVKAVFDLTIIDALLAIGGWSLGAELNAKEFLHEKARLGIKSDALKVERAYEELLADIGPSSTMPINLNCPFIERHLRAKTA